MPRYFFDRTDGSASKDLEGTELPSLADARCQAVLYAAATLLDRPSMIWDGGEFEVTVTDEVGGKLFVVTISASSVEDGADR